MPVTNYLTVNGEIIGESTGGVRTDYLTDALGSVTATVDQSASVVNTYRYKPYGELLAKTGTGSDPVFGWVGSQGYAGTGRKYAEQYVRARHYSSTNARWTTKDPIGQGGGDLNYYRYVENRPTTYSDLEGTFQDGPKRESSKQKPCALVHQCLNEDKYGWNCKPGHGCSKRHEISQSLAICVMYHESKLDPESGRRDDNGGGIGQLTCYGIEDVVCSGCSRGTSCPVYGQLGLHTQRGVKGDKWCLGAQAAYMYMQCRGLNYPGGYGDKTYTPGQIARFKKCEKCLAAGNECSTCTHMVLKPGKKR